MRGDVLTPDDFDQAVEAQLAKARALQLRRFTKPENRGKRLVEQERADQAENLNYLIALAKEALLTAGYGAGVARIKQGLEG